MINNAILQTGGSVSASIPSHAVLRNPFLAVKNDISIRKPGVELMPCITLSEQVLTLKGFAEITAANCNQFRKTACAAWNRHTDVEIDLSQTTLIDCSGLGALIAVRNLIRGRNGVTRLINPSSSVQQMLDLTQTRQLFEIVNAPPAGLAFGPVAHN